MISAQNIHFQLMGLTQMVRLMKIAIASIVVTRTPVISV